MYTERNEIISGSKDSTIRVWKVEESLLKLGTPKQTAVQAKETGTSKEQEQTQSNQSNDQTQPQKPKTIVTTTKVTKTVTTTTTTTTTPPPQSTKKHLFGKDFFRTKK